MKLQVPEKQMVELNPGVLVMPTQEASGLRYVNRRDLRGTQGRMPPASA
jgi:hypothetical protein